MFKNMALDTGQQSGTAIRAGHGCIQHVCATDVLQERRRAALQRVEDVALLASLVERGDFDFHAVSMPVSRWMRLLGLPIQGGRDVNRYLEHTEALETEILRDLPGAGRVFQASLDLPAGVWTNRTLISPAQS